MYTFDSKIRYSEVDNEGILKISSLIDYFQDCSIFQSEDLGWGFKPLWERNLGWLLAAWQIEIKRLPVFAEEVVTGTAAYSFKGFMGQRCFKMTTKSGELLAQADSIWCLYNFKDQKMVPGPKEMVEAYPNEPRLDMPPMDRKIRVPEGSQKVGSVVITEDYLDTNNHVNNGRFVQLAMGYFSDSKNISAMRIMYKKQAYLGNEIFVYVNEGDTTVISLCDENKDPYVVFDLRKDAV